jgi:hypothetical protein
VNVGHRMKRLAIVAMIAWLPAAASAFDRYAGLAEAEHQPSDLSKALNLVMSTATPDLYFHTREIMVEDYEKAAVNKALAVNLRSAEYWQTTDQDSKSVTPDRALEGCQLRFGSPCKLLAVNDELVQLAGPLADHDMPRLSYSGGFDPNQLPIVKDDVRKRPDIQTYLSAQRPKAIAIHPIGQMFVVSGSPTDKDAADAALARCDFASGRKKSDGPCYLYSLNNDVVIAKRHTFPSMLSP